MTLSRRFVALLGAFFVLPFVLSACGGGGGVPGNAVVKIGSDTIKTREFDHWLAVAAKTQAQQTGQTNVQVPVPPDFTACIANAKKNAPAPAKGQPKPTDAQFKAQCQTQYNQLRDQVLQFLISSAWVEGEAWDRGVKVSDQQVKKDFDTQRGQTFPQDSDYQKFLQGSGYIQEDLLYRIRVQDLSNKLRTAVLKGTDKISDASIASYYNKNKSRFAVPEKRDIRIVLTKTEAKAKQALAALKSGQSFKKVAANYSIDQGTRDTGGLLAQVPKGQQEASLDKASFAAPKGKIEGPVKTQFGFYVFQVVKIYPGSQQTLDQAKANIKQLLINQNQQAALDKFVKDFQKKWKGRTDCRKDYVTADYCKNAPKSATTATTAAAPATTVQNAPPANGSATTTTSK